MEDKDNPVITEGLAVITFTVFLMGGDEQHSRAAALAQWDRLGRPPGVFLAAAAAMSGLPQPLEESAAETERMRPVRKMLGVTPVSEHYAAELRGREVLQELAREYG